jgi:hypothetical protein
VIARIWRGWTTPENADAYQEIVSQEVLPGIAARNLDGYHGAYLLRRRLDDEVEFATILLFDTWSRFAPSPATTTRLPMSRPRRGRSWPASTSARPTTTRCYNRDCEAAGRSLAAACTQG